MERERFLRRPLEPSNKDDIRRALKIEAMYPDPSCELLGKPNVQPYECRECNKSFLCERSVDRHLWYHLRRQVSMFPETTDPDQPHQCSTCGEQFRIQRMYLEHVHTHQGFSCTPQCQSRTYPNKANLQLHALSRHSRHFFYKFLRAEKVNNLFREHQ